mgnify:CR=1 FL=1
MEEKVPVVHMWTVNVVDGLRIFGAGVFLTCSVTPDRITKMLLLSGTNQGLNRLKASRWRRCLHEADVSTKAEKAEKSARFPEADEYEKRP